MGILVKRLVKLHGSKDYGINNNGLLTEPNLLAQISTLCYIFDVSYGNLWIFLVLVPFS